MRQHDEQQAKIAREQGLPVRARIQNEARAARRRRSTEIRASEQARQWDLQRPDIHTALVSERLAEVQAEITQVVTLADPVPDAEPDRPVRVLPVRYVQRRGATFMTHPLWRQGHFRRNRLRETFSTDAA
jgi:hypothetical protein